MAIITYNCYLCYNIGERGDIMKKVKVLILACLLAVGFTASVSPMSASAHGCGNMPCKELEWWN